MSCPSRSRASYQSSRVVSSLPNFADANPQQVHIAFNLCLFPPLFFFSGLYYTDVASTLFVLLFFKHFFNTHSRGMPSLLQSLVSILLGLLSLSFRQTNIFWVAVFPAGFAVIGAIAERREQARAVLGRSATVQASLRSVVAKAWQDGVLYDPQIRGAWIEGTYLHRSDTPLVYPLDTDSSQTISSSLYLLPRWRQQR